MPRLLTKDDDWGGEDEELRTKVYILDPKKRRGERGYQETILTGEFNQETLNDIGYKQVDEENGIPVLVKIKP